MADRSMHCVMLNNQSSRASMAGDKSRDLQANGGGGGMCVCVCVQSRGWEGRVGWDAQKYPKEIALIMLKRLGQLNSIKTNPKKTFYLHSTFQAVSF